MFIQRMVKAQRHVFVNSRPALLVSPPCLRAFANVDFDAIKAENSILQVYNNLVE